MYWGKSGLPGILNLLLMYGVQFLWLALFLPMIRATFSISPVGSTLVQCSKTNLIWTESPPIHLWAAPNRDISPGDPTLIDFGIINETYILWTVNLPVGQNVSFTYVQQSDPDNLLSSPQQYTVVAGSSSSCLPSYSSSFSSSSSTSSSSSIMSLSSSMSPSSSASPVSSQINPQIQYTTTRSYKTLIGGIVGAMVAVVIICAAIVLWVHRRRSKQPQHVKSTSVQLIPAEGSSFESLVTPFPLPSVEPSISGYQESLPMQWQAFEKRKGERRYMLENGSFSAESMHEMDVGSSLKGGTSTVTLPPSYSAR